jgi:CheY-like chemotaxis protein
VSNLLTNAVKFTPPRGRIEVRLDTIGSMARICIADNGQGIDPVFLPHVFDRFWQADSSTTRAHGGLGLGLAIVQHIAEMHGGRVRVNSPGVGLGATFAVELPLSVDAATSALEGRPTQGDQSGLLAVLKNACVLVIDDQADSRDLVDSLLSGSGALVVTAGSVAEGLHAVRDRSPELIVCDIGMPYADGFELLRQLRAMRDPHAGTPAIALTAYAREEDRQRALTAGFQAHIGKPFDGPEFLRVAAGLISKTRSV